MKKIWSMFALILSLTGCATAFYGSAKVPNGPAGCQQQCGACGMDMGGMVAMGEYSDGCICQVRGQGSKPSANAISGAAPAIAGVWTEMQARQQAIRTNVLEPKH